MGVQSLGWGRLPSNGLVGGEALGAPTITTLLSAKQKRERLQSLFFFSGVRIRIRTNIGMFRVGSGSGYTSDQHFLQPWIRIRINLKTMRIIIPVFFIYLFIIFLMSIRLKFFAHHFIGKKCDFFLALALLN